jgi:hypothetical protein
MHGDLLLRHLQADPLARRAGETLDALQHAVQHSPGEVGLRVGEPGWIVGAGSLAQGQETLSLQLRDQRRPLPGRAVLYEAPGHHGDQLTVLSD